MRYFDLIFTRHAQEKMEARGIKMADAWKTFKHTTRSTKDKYGGVRFEKEFDDFKITVVAFQNQKNEWVVKSVWRNPPLQGTSDAKQKEYWKKYNKTGFWEKAWIVFKQQLGLA